MNKIIDGIELLKMIKDEEIKNGTEIELYFANKLIDTLILKDNNLIIKRTNKYLDTEYFTGIFTSNIHKFRVLVNNEINIQAIEKIESVSASVDGTEQMKTMGNMAKKINEVIDAVQQLDKHIRYNN